jgi:hypothetical protein
MNELEEAKKALQLALIELGSLLKQPNESIDTIPNELLAELSIVLQLELDSRNLRIYN